MHPRSLIEAGCALPRKRGWMKNAAKRTRQHARIILLDQIFFLMDGLFFDGRTKPYIEAACCLKIFEIENDFLSNKQS